jgi:hypothetical protein
MGSDWPVTTPDPTAAIHLAVNRSLPDDDAPARNPSESHRPERGADGVHIRRAWVTSRTRRDR